MKTNTSNQATAKKQIFSNSYRNRKPLTEAQKEALTAKREELKKLSKPLKKQKDKGKIESINAGLKAIYAKQGHTELKTLTEWNKGGYSVNKGEKALLLWGSKKTTVPRETEATADPYEFFPLCYVFSNLQVTEKSKNNAKN